MRFSSKAILLSLLLAFTFFSCRTDAPTTSDTNTTIVNYKHGNQKTVFAALPAKVKSLNPLLHRTNYSQIVYRTAVQPLMDMSFDGNAVVPILAQSKPEIKEITTGEYAGGMSYTYRLKEEARWGNGTAVTFEDVIFSVKAAFAPNVSAPLFVPYYSAFTDIKQDETDPKKFTVFTKEKYILGEGATGYIHVMPEYVYDENKVLRNYSLKDLKNQEKAEDLSKKEDLLAFAEAFNSPKFSREILSGSGAYTLAEWEAGQRIVMVKKKDWWGSKYEGQNMFFTSYPDTIFFRILPDNTAQTAAVQNEDVDVAFSMNSSDFKNMRDNDERLNDLFNFYSPAAYNFYFTYLNTKSPFLSDKNVRRALAHLVDVEAVIENLYDGMATAQAGPVSPNTYYYNEDIKSIPYDLEKAKSLLTAAGWQDTDDDGVLDKEIDGKRRAFELDYVSSDTKYAVNLAAYLKETFADAGIKLKTEIMEFAATRERISKREFDMASGALGGTPADRDFSQIYSLAADTPRGFNRSGFGNEESEAVLAKIKTAIDKEERIKYYKEFQQIMYDEQPKIFFFAPQERIVIHKRLSGKYAGYVPYVYLPSLQLANKK